MQILKCVLKDLSVDRVLCLEKFPVFNDKDSVTKKEFPEEQKVMLSQLGTSLIAVEGNQPAITISFYHFNANAFSTKLRVNCILRWYMNNMVQLL